MTLDGVLGWMSLAAAVAALAVYGLFIVRRFQMIRLLTGLGLFLTGLALFQAPNILSQTPGQLHVRLAVLALILAVVAQIVSALRTRPEWSGVDRRGAAGQTS